MIKGKYIDSPVAVISVGTPKSRTSAQKILTKQNVNFPYGVDLAGATYALWELHPTTTYGFVIDEDGKIVYGFDLTYSYQSPGRPGVFVTDCGRYLKDAKDPFGITSVPDECKSAYALLKVGRFEDARTMAKKLLRSASAAEVAKQIIAAAEKVEAERFERMGALAEAGDAGELQEEYKAFLVAFPKSKLKSKAKSLVSKAGRSGDGKNEATAAKNFDRALMYLDRRPSQGLMLLRAIGDKYEGTHYGGLAKTLGAKLK